MEMEIKHHENETKGFFDYHKDGVLLGELSYTKAGAGLIIIDHTFVDPSLRGTGTGKELVRKGVEFARENGYKIEPLCPFANAIIKRETAFQDVLSV